MELPQNYSFKEAEKKWNEYWEKEGIYKFDPNDEKREIYSIDTPPPTVSGKMHLGHAFSYSQQDFVVRFHRMLGKNVFYPFGTDDNGLATIRLIEQEKKVKDVALGREGFINLVLETLEKELRPSYLQDWKRIGISCDWSIFYTTIDKHCQKISQKSFIDLYKKGREYRKRTPFFWCPECQTAIAQVEMKDSEQDSQLIYMKFDTTIKKQIIIATTRPELMGACVMVHVHPDDERYKEFIGAEAIIPFYNRKVPIKANRDVAMDFGSGAVYHCTFGDMDDVVWLEREKIPAIEIENKDGTLNEKAGKYKGMAIKRARSAVTDDLKKEERIEKIEPIRHVVNVHERCGTDIEILTTDQWFIKYLDLKDEMIKWGNALNWHPEYMKVRYENWVHGLKYDWCISRQRFFGVPFPLWYCRKCNEVILAEEKQLPVDPLKDNPPVKKCPKCGCDEFIPEKDVLDTWATSSLTPRLAIELMPEKIQKRLYPMSLRPQAHDIITFWLFNTVVKSQLHYKINPWKDVMIAGHAQDPHGKKMSKSKGNVVEPQSLVDKYGADCLRFWAAGSKLGEDLPYQEKDLVTGQKFTIKLWNASKFCFIHLEKYEKGKNIKLEMIDRWLLSKLNKIIKNATESFNEYEYSKTKAETENFFWHVFCDYYLEIIKDRLYNVGTYSKDAVESAKYTLYMSLLTILKLMAPIMPFITEEIFQTYFADKEKAKSIHISEWPECDKKLIDENAEKIGELVCYAVEAARQAKSEKKISLKEPVKKMILRGKISKEDFKKVEKDIIATAKVQEMIYEELKKDSKIDFENVIDL
ncbi:MAG: valine--tRNA ligase [Candidatus Woesearchaeota archaeon]|nr:valine--tRNA ligase [Candidatus Woesearchaeota archaeon]